jgi:hypothetical protein
VRVFSWDVQGAEETSELDGACGKLKKGHPDIRGQALLVLSGFPADVLNVPL